MARELHKKKNKELYEYLCIFALNSIQEYFNKFSKEFMNKNYDILHNFAKSLYIDERCIDNNSNFETNQYEEYILIKSSKNYSEYLLNKNIMQNINSLNNINNYNNNWLRLFGINISKKYLVIVIFGIKISIKLK